MKKILALIIAVGVGTAVWVSADRSNLNNQSASDQANQVISNSNQSVPPVNLNHNLAAPVPLATHPVSIPALMEYQLTGRDLKLGRVLAENSSYTRYYITYRSDDLTISGIMNIPKGNGPFPVLFLNHGYIDTSVYTNGRGLKREQDYFARQGFAVLHSDYRCHADSTCPENDPLAQRLFYAKDVMNAVEAVRASPDTHLDKSRFGMLGHSMGGGISQTIMVVKPDLVKAIVLYAPVSSDYRDSFQRYTKRRPTEVKKITDRYKTPEDNKEFWVNLAPRKFFDRITAKIELHQGTNDADIPKEWSDTTVALLKSAGKEITYHVYPGQPHEFSSAWGTLMQRSTSFFERALQ